MQHAVGGSGSPRLRPGGRWRPTPSDPAPRGAGPRSGPRCARPLQAGARGAARWRDGASHRNGILRSGGETSGSTDMNGATNDRNRNPPAIFDPPLFKKKLAPCLLCANLLKHPPTAVRGRVW